MSKQRKTRQQKIISQLRRKLSSTNPRQDLSPEHVKQPSYTLSSRQTYIKTISQKQDIKTLSYPYLKTDLIKTTAITGIIVSVELVLFVLQKNINLF